MNGPATAISEKIRTQPGSMAPCYVCAKTFEAPSEGYSGEGGDLCHDCMGHLIGIFEEHLLDAAMRQAPDDPQLAQAMERAISNEVTRLEVLHLLATGRLLCRVHEPTGELEYKAASADEPRPARLS